MMYVQPVPSPLVSPRVGKIVQTGREQIHMLESGSAGADPVVLLHGCGSIAEEVMMPFSGSGLHILAPDRPGYGFSAALPAGERGPLGQSFWLERLLEAVRYVAAQLQQKIPTAILNRTLLDAVDRRQPVSAAGHRLKFFYATQVRQGTVVRSMIASG